MTTTTEPRHWRAIFDDIDREVSNLDFPLLHGEVIQPRMTELIAELRGCLVAIEVNQQAFERELKLRLGALT